VLTRTSGSKWRGFDCRIGRWVKSVEVLAKTAGDDSLLMRLTKMKTRWEDGGDGWERSFGHAYGLRCGGSASDVESLVVKDSRPGYFSST